ncbi:unnamed protein product [Lactuca saligna]|uniref:Uncharacterized protein n=1 Tax=Lactuca saligna TaxID=75948 RepID=A0AA35ZLP7_LACSI|nr:unnamed protein product [Lactuca saligna]
MAVALPLVSGVKSRRGRKDKDIDRVKGKEWNEGCVGRCTEVVNEGRRNLALALRRFLSDRRRRGYLRGLARPKQWRREETTELSSSRSAAGCEGGKEIEGILGGIADSCSDEDGGAPWDFGLGGRIASIGNQSLREPGLGWHREGGSRETGCGDVETHGKRVVGGGIGPPVMVLGRCRQRRRWVTTGAVHRSVAGQFYGFQLKECGICCFSLIAHDHKMI